MRAVGELDSQPEKSRLLPCARRAGRKTHRVCRADERTWHAGKSEWHGRKDLNSWSIGASFEGDTNSEPLTLDAMASMAEYLVPIMRQYSLTLADVTDHRTVAPGRKDDLAWRELERFKAYLEAGLLKKCLCALNNATRY
jgi:N-acetyl-anhydromuramyl-L-alanine amidase AmpD